MRRITLAAFLALLSVFFARPILAADCPCPEVKTKTAAPAKSVKAWKPTAPAPIPGPPGPVGPPGPKGEKGDPGEIHIVPMPEPPADVPRETSGNFFVPLTAGYLRGPFGAAGIGYQWANKIALSGQAYYGQVNGVDGVSSCALGCRSCSAAFSGETTKEWGGAITVSIPIP